MSPSATPLPLEHSKKFTATRSRNKMFNNHHINHIPPNAPGDRTPSLFVSPRRGKRTATNRDGYSFEYGRALAYFHSWKNGALQFQGFIDSYDGEQATGVLFSFTTGEISDRIDMTSQMLSRCSFYDNDAELRAANDSWHTAPYRGF